MLKSVFIGAMTEARITGEQLAGHMRGGALFSGNPGVLVLPAPDPLDLVLVRLLALAAAAQRLHLTLLAVVLEPPVDDPLLVLRQL